MRLVEIRLERGKPKLKEEEKNESQKKKNKKCKQIESEERLESESDPKYTIDQITSFENNIKQARKQKKMNKD